MSEIQFKIQIIRHNGSTEYRRVRLLDPTFDAIHTVMKEYTKGVGMVMEYVDEEGDHIVLDCEEDWIECRGICQQSGMNVVRIRLTTEVTSTPTTPRKCQNCNFTASGRRHGACCKRCSKRPGVHGPNCRQVMFDQSEHQPTAPVPDSLTASSDNNQISAVEPFPAQSYEQQNTSLTQEEVSMPQELPAEDFSSLVQRSTYSARQPSEVLPTQEEINAALDLQAAAIQESRYSMREVIPTQEEINAALDSQAAAIQREYRSPTREVIPTQEEINAALDSQAAAIARDACSSPKPNERSASPELIDAPTRGANVCSTCWSTTSGLNADDSCCAKCHRIPGKHDRKCKRLEKKNLVATIRNGLRLRKGKGFTKRHDDSDARDMANETDIEMVNRAKQPSVRSFNLEAATEQIKTMGFEINEKVTALIIKHNGDVAATVAVLLGPQ
eukprot:TRINITY_DN281_c0_g1_i8.p1 TRINITY_DN281_c0_g1~~TRINITY_DN281_c0_g1_i8.p1  ORF type:complete len:494 (+),score=96.37 TRINITY_DN281_c0_g1_i8:156-1484(+)